MAIFESPAWLLTLPVLLPLLWRLGREQRVTMRDRRGRLRFIWRAACLTALVLALAGLRFPSSRAQIDVVAAVDLSDSIYDRAPQEASLRQLATRLKDSGARLGVVTFGGNAVAERLPAPWLDPPKPATGDALPLPDLRRSKVNGKETDIGGALDRARGLLDPSASGRAIVLLSDGQDTVGQAGERAAALRGSGIDLLAWPATLGGTDDVVLAGLRLPERASQDRDVAIEVTVAAQRALRVRVRLGRKVSQGIEPVGAPQDVTLAQEGREFRATLRFIDRPKGPGVIVYVAALEGPDGNPLPGDYRQNNMLMGALQVDGPSRWLAVARPETTLAEWARRGGAPLGVEMTGIAPRQLPDSLDAYTSLTGVIVGDLSATELPDDAPALKALSTAVENGLALVALGGEQAFGAGQHAEGGNWEDLLPVTFRPEDDRTRTVLFLLDISATMSGQMAGRQEQKLAFACARLSEVAQPGPESRLRVTDRVGLITFADRADLVVEPRADPERRTFREKLGELRTSRQTNFLAALELARQVLAKDDAEERLVIFVSDGEPTPAIPDEELEKAVRTLCPKEGEKRRTRLHTFGIATGPADRNPQGEVRLKQMAAAGGGTFFPDFLQLAEGLKQVLHPEQPDFYVRRDAFVVRSPFPQHPLLDAAGPWPELNFRNRVRARPAAMTLTQSAPAADQDGPRKADPLVVLGHQGLGSTAAVALTIDGAAGRRFLEASDSWKGGQAFLAALISWVERGDQQARAGWRIETEERQGRLHVRVEARDPQSRGLKSGLQLAARLVPVFGMSATTAPVGLLPTAPGIYEGELELRGHESNPSDERSSIHRLDVFSDERVAQTRYISAPYPKEYRRFGTDRMALAECVQRAGGRSRMLDVPDNLNAWLKEVETQRTWLPARPILLILAALCLLASLATRGLKRR